MIRWDFNSKEYEEASNFKPVPVGPHRVRLEQAEERYSKTGKDMIRMTFQVSGYQKKIFHYLVFDPANSQMTNKNLGDIYESFGIPVGEMNLIHWVNRVGAAHIKHEDYEGKPVARIAWFLTKRKQETLPPWQEPKQEAWRNNDGTSMRDDLDFTKAVGDEAQSDCPF